MASLTDTAEVEVQKFLLGGSPTAPTAPLMVRLMTANGTDSAAGTEVTGDGYAAKSATFDATTGLNTAEVDYGVLDSSGNRTLTGFEIWDSAGTPKRWLHAAFGSPVTVNAGDSCKFAAGALSVLAD